jgi:hypothetical protein
LTYLRHPLLLRGFRGFGAGQIFSVPALAAA